MKFSAALLFILTSYAVQIDGLKCYNCISEQLEDIGPAIPYSKNCTPNWEEAPTIDSPSDSESYSCFIALVETGDKEYIVRGVDWFFKDQAAWKNLAKLQEREHLGRVTLSLCNSDLCNSAPTVLKAAGLQLGALLLSAIYVMG